MCHSSACVKYWHTIPSFDSVIYPFSTGEVISEKDRCKKCEGKKVVKEVKILEVHVDKGMKQGQKITFGGEADQAPGVEPGDIVLVLQEKDHEVGAITFLWLYTVSLIY